MLLAIHEYIPESLRSLGEIINIDSTTEKPSESIEIIGTIVTLGSFPVNCIAPWYHTISGAGEPRAVHVNTVSFPSTTVTSSSDGELVIVDRAALLAKEQGKEECRTLYTRTVLSSFGE